MATDAHYRLAVILHADVVGSTVLVRKDERIAHHRIQIAFHGLADEIRARGGIVNEIRGDALVAEFSRASDAVLAAMSAQQRNTARNVRLRDEIRPQLRVGIALGEVVIADSTVTGAGVVLAQRIEQLSAADGICISGAIREAVPDRLPLEYRSLGDKTLKGFDEPVRVLAITLKAGEAIPAAAPKSRTGKDTGRSKRRAQVVALSICLLAGAALGIWWVFSSDEATGANPAPPPSAATSPPDTRPRASSKPESATSTTDATHSIAVLPFVNMSDEPGQAYFSDGLSEDIITDLAQISGLFVIARNSSFRYKGQAVDVKAVGQELGVRYIVEGSVRKEGQRLRITAQLIDVESGMHIWAERYDRNLTDVFKLQDEVTRTIVAALSVTLTADEVQLLSASEDVGVEAYDLLLRGNEAMGLFTAQAMLDARAIYHQVIQINPRYARAHANIAFTYAQEALFGWSDDQEATIRHGLKAAEDARQLDDRLPQLHLTLASLAGAQLQWEKAARAARRGIELEPNYADSHVLLAVSLTFLGELEAAATAIAKAKRLNPHFSAIYLWVEARVLYLQQRYQEAAELLEDAARRNPEFDQTRIMLAATYAQLGRIDDAKWEAEQILMLQPKFTIWSDLRVRGFRDRAHEALYIDGLRKAGLPE